MVTTSRRAGRVTNKTKLLIYRGSDKVDLGLAEVVVWENQHDGNSSSSDGGKPHHVGAKGVESGELLEHHLQAALSSASLIHSRATPKPSSPTPASNSRQKPDSAAAVAAASNASLNYHIPTPDATGLVQNADFAAQYEHTKYHEPVNYVRYSETVEESCAGAGGLGYCMDEEDEVWLTGFNSKAEGGSGGAGGGGGGGGGGSSEPMASPLRETSGHNQAPVSAGRERRMKGKDKEKDTPPSPVYISEDLFEYVMGMLEKFVDDTIPTLHTDLSRIPNFASVEHLFSSPVSASFYPAYEVPKGLPEPKSLTRIARNIYPHWKQRREIRKGKSIFPGLNYDETNDGDPYVCFRRRDIRATRKTRRTDNYSVEKFQKLQYELKAASQLSSMVMQRERQKQASFKVDKELWEAKWKLFETKRKWPSLGLTPQEDELITGRAQHQQVQQQARAAESLAMANGANALHAQSQNVPQARKKQPDREKDDRERRERAIEAARAAEKGVAAGGRSMAPESLKERMQVLAQKLEERMSRRAAADADWDDLTDTSYQPLPRPAAERAFRAYEFLVPNGSSSRDSDLACRAAAFRLRRGRGGLMRLDRRNPIFPRPRGNQPTSPLEYADWLFPDTFADKPYSKRPKSIDDVDADADTPDEDETVQQSKRRRLNEVRRYDVDSGGAVGVGMGISRDDDRIIIDDQDPKYIRNRVSLLREDDFLKLQPDMSIIAQTHAALDAPVELPPLPEFIRPEIPAINPMLQQQLIQQQSMERMQAMAAYAQQAAYLQQQQQAQMQQGVPQIQPQPQQQQQLLQQQQQLQQLQQQMPGPTPNQPHPRAPSDASINGHGSPAVGNPMLPPQSNSMPNMGVQAHGRPPVAKRPSSQNGNHPNVTVNGQPMPNVPLGPGGQQRPSVSPTYSMQGAPQINGNGNPNQSPQMVNGAIPPNGKPHDPAMQRMLAARMAQNMQQQQQQQHQQMPMGEDGQIQMQQLPLQPQMQHPQQQQQVPQPITNGSISLAGMTPEQHQAIATLAEKAGFRDNIAGFLDARNKASMLKMARAQQEQQAQTLAAQRARSQQQQQQQQANPVPAPASANGSSNGNGNGSTPNANASPNLPSGQLNLKLPPHAAARLGAKSGQQSPAQRAS